MNIIKKIGVFFSGVWKEAKRVRWAKGPEFKANVSVVFGWAFFFGLFLVICDWVVANLLQWIGFI